MSDQSRVVFQPGTKLMHSPTTLAAFVGKMTAGITPRPFADDKRLEPRYTLSTIVEAQAVDKQFQPIDEVFKAVTRDLSVGGIGLTHNQEIKSEYLAIQLTNAEGDRIQTVVEVVRTRPHDNMWEIGGQFVTSAGDAPVE